MIFKPQASEKQHFHTEEELRLVVRACPDIRRVVFKLSPESDATVRTFLHLVEFQQLQHLETWGGGFREAQLDRLLEVVGPNIRCNKLSYLYNVHTCTQAELGKRPKFFNVATPTRQRFL